MLRNVARGILNRVRRILRRDPDAFLKHSNGVIHIGANAGQERDQYASLGLPVIWVEPIPEVFEALRSNISSCPNQKALRYLITDEDGKEYDFHVANNNGASSSILEFARHGEIWPEIKESQRILSRHIMTIFPIPAVLLFAYRTATAATRVCS